MRDEALEDVARRGKTEFEDAVQTAADVTAWLSRLSMSAPHLFVTRPAPRAPEQAVAVPEAVRGMSAIQRLSWGHQHHRR